MSTCYSRFLPSSHHASFTRHTAHEREREREREREKIKKKKKKKKGKKTHSICPRWEVPTQTMVTHPSGPAAPWRGSQQQHASQLPLLLKRASHKCPSPSRGAVMVRRGFWSLHFARSGLPVLRRGSSNGTSKRDEDVETRPSQRGWTQQCGRHSEDWLYPGEDSQVVRKGLIPRTHRSYLEQGCTSAGTAWHTSRHIWWRESSVVFCARLN